MKTVHDRIMIDLFSSPKNLANQKRLFTSVPDLSTQGNSRGQVNNPKVFSEGAFICGSCDQSYTTNEEVTNHKSEAHENVNFQFGVCRKVLISNEEDQNHNDKNHKSFQQELNEEEEVLEKERKKGRDELRVKKSELIQQLHIRDKNQSHMLIEFRKDASNLKNSLEKQRNLEAELSRMKEAAEKECDQCVMRAEVEADQRSKKKTKKFSKPTTSSRKVKKI